MKHAKTAIVILLVIPLFLIGVQIWLHHTTDSMGTLVARAEELSRAGETDRASRQVAAFQHSWDRKKGILAVFIKHSELDVVNLSAAKLPAYLGSDDPAEFEAEAAALKIQLHHLWESEQFSLDNIL